MRVLGAYEIPSQALFVGGCVRNTLLEKPVADIDIATTHQPLRIIEKLQAEGIRFAPTGLEHGTITAIIDDAVFEITTLRKDIATNGRHAVIAFTEKWTEDAERRDFTINTLLAAPDGMIFDPTGRGLSDLDLRKISFVGNADLRIAEDYLRILRFFRFYAQYGEELDKDALAACKKHAETISKLSKERVTQEFLKICAVPKAADILDLMFTNDVLVDMAEHYKASVMERLCDLQIRNENVNVMARLLVVSDMREDFFEPWLVLSNAQKKELELIAQNFAALKAITRKKVRELVYRTGNVATAQAYLLKFSMGIDAPDMDLFEIARYWQAPFFPIRGEDLIKAGMTPGPEMGKKLKKLEEKWILSDFSKVPKY